MEYVLVHFPSPRRVIMDDAELGDTEKVLAAGTAGTRTFRLAPADGVDPPEITQPVYGTTRESPLELSFQQVGP